MRKKLLVLSMGIVLALSGCGSAATTQTEEVSVETSAQDSSVETDNSSTDGNSTGTDSEDQSTDQSTAQASKEDVDVNEILDSCNMIQILYGFDPSSNVFSEEEYWFRMTADMKQNVSLLNVDCAGPQSNGVEAGNYRMDGTENFTKLIDILKSCEPVIREDHESYKPTDFHGDPYIIVLVYPYGYSPNAIYHDYYIQITNDSDELEDFLLDVYNQVKEDKVE